ncbi:ATP-grasp domain-containing protein [Bacteroides sp.]|uniref:ATP-grasp domain-containing protein n=1 Tax=Bacteroides sp. TaxID=29523 RepID=UPI002616EFDA|nr:ATP-grasp domain-containing protein [Bacteroides sp.]MDD3037981.1 ATP-grasp domain-containing protein [Bacteroides sp.]
MKNKLSGKKILILGGKPIGSFEIVKYAKENGVYTIVTDFLPKEKSKAKQIADECLDISTADVDVLSKYVIDQHIDGIYTGVHEFNVEMAMKICSQTGRPFYATQEQWEICTDKALFKKKCKEYGLPVAHDYSIHDMRNIIYPVIIKPVDGSSGKGISICYTEDELLVAYDYAISVSLKKEVVIEEYLYGDEIVVFYTIANGESRLSAISDYYYNYDQKVTMPLPQLYVYPSRYLCRFMLEMDATVRSFLANLEIKNGTFFLQAFVNKDGFSFFEPGYRPGGSSVYKYTSYLNNISYIDMLVNYSLTGSVGEIDINLENPNFSKPCCTLSLVAKGGCIKQIIGYEQACQIKEVIDSEKRYDIGDYIKENSALMQIVLRFFIVADNKSRMKEVIDIIQNTVQVCNDKDENMLIAPFNIERIV